MIAAICAEGLQKQFGSTLVVDQVTLSVRQGTCFGFIGPNGAGKTTTIRLLAGLLTPTAGLVRIFGQSYDEAAMAIRARLGLVQDDLLLYEYLTGEEQALFISRLYNLEANLANRRAEELFLLLGLEDCRRRLIRSYSKGERKKLTLLCALIHDPDLLFLDEPFEGMDVMGLRTVEEILRQMIQRGKTVFLTSHILSWVDRLCAEIAIINQGKIVFFGPKDLLQSTLQTATDRRNKGSDLEQVFLALIHAEKQEGRLSWFS